MMLLALALAATLTTVAVVRATTVTVFRRKLEPDDALRVVVADLHR